jgi:guanyl-specific ribonuclease Sa
MNRYRPWGTGPAWFLALAFFGWLGAGLLGAGAAPAQAAQGVVGTEDVPQPGGASLLADKGKDRKDSGSSIKLPKGVPAKVGKVLKYIDEHKKAPEGYVGGRTFGNFEKHLPTKDRRGKPIKYQEWDVNPKVQGKNRGPERLVTGSDGSAYYTKDHYKTFIKIR